MRAFCDIPMAWLLLASSSLAFSTPNLQSLRHQSKSVVSPLQSSSLSGEEVVQRLQDQLAKLRERDRRSIALRPEDLKVVYEDDDIIVVDKPSGVLCVPSEPGIPSLAQAVFEKCRRKSSRDDCGITLMDQMVTHRLGMDTSGLVVFAKNIEALRGMNTLFRTRRVTRQYEALVCGHVTIADAIHEDGEFGWITYPLMRDYECPPFMRVSTEEHQNVLVDFDPLVVGKRLLEAPKMSLTKYEVISKEDLSAKGDNATDQDASNNEGLPVTRLRLTAITGRTHQLNVHMAAFGHPIIGDVIYGNGGDALPNGGLSADFVAKKNKNRANEALQQRISKFVSENNINMCVHAKCLSFRHPITQEDVVFLSDAPF